MTPDDERLRTMDGRPLTGAHARLLAAGGRVRIASVVRAAPPVEAGDVVELVAGRDLARGDIVACASDGTYRLVRLRRPHGRGWVARDEPGGDPVDLDARDVVAVVAAVEPGDLRFELRHGRWRRYGRLLAGLPARASVLGRALARLERVRRPLFPPLRMGSPEELVARVREAYEEEIDVLVAREELVDEERRVLARWLRPGLAILDVGCGGGREAFAFADAGLDVTAIDLSPRLVAVGRERADARGARVEFAVADLATFAPARRFDVVYLTQGVYAHIPTRARRVATLAHAAGLLAPGGVVVLAPLLFPPPRALSRPRLVDGLRRLLRALRVRGVSEPGDGYHRGCARRPWPGSFRYLHRFTGAAEIVAEIEAAGFVVEDRLPDAPVWVLRPVAT